MKPEQPIGRETANDKEAENNKLSRSNWSTDKNRNKICKSLLNPVFLLSGLWDIWSTQKSRYQHRYHLVGHLANLVAGGLHTFYKAYWSLSVVILCPSTSVWARLCTWLMTWMFGRSSVEEPLNPGEALSTGQSEPKSTTTRPQLTPTKADRPFCPSFKPKPKKRPPPLPNPQKMPQKYNKAPHALIL